MSKRFASLVGVVALAFGVAGSVHPGASAQAATMALPMTGSVVNMSGQPVAGAEVIFQRYATSAFGGRSVEMLGRSRTDEQGTFSFGSIAVKNELAFPVESSMRLEYAVSANGQSLQLDNVTFTAPRNGSAIASVSAAIQVH